MSARLEVGDPCPGSGRPGIGGHLDDGAIGLVCPVCGTAAGKTTRRHTLGAFELEALRATATARARPLRAARNHLDRTVAYLRSEPLADDGTLGLCAFKLSGQGNYIDHALEALEPFLDDVGR